MFDGLQDCSTKLKRADDQPDGVEMHMSDGVFIKQMRIRRAGTYVPQHSHAYDHTSMLAKGSIRVWEDGELSGDYEAPTGLMIKKGVKHTFLSLVDDTVVYCIHNLHGSDAVKVLEEHDLLEEV